MPSDPKSGEHRVEITFDGGAAYLKLLCPESGCTPASDCVCGQCGRDPRDSESKPCYDCSGPPSDECWIRSWVDNLTAEELLSGKITVPVRAVAESGDDYITLEIIEAVAT